jgi:hypothetical protein
MEVTYVLNSQIMSYILKMLICVGMILLDNPLQCFLDYSMHVITFSHTYRVPTISVLSLTSTIVAQSKVKFGVED